MTDPRDYNKFDQPEHLADMFYTPISKEHQNQIDKHNAETRLKEILSPPDDKPLDSSSNGYFRRMKEHRRVNAAVRQEHIDKVEQDRAKYEAISPLDQQVGGSTPSQYRKSLSLPMTADRAMYRTVDVEVGDISDVFDFDGNQKDIFKALCRDKHDDDYDLNKIVYYALRNRYNKSDNVSHAEFWKQCVACGVAKEI